MKPHPTESASDVTDLNMLATVASIIAGFGAAMLAPERWLAVTWGLSGLFVFLWRMLR